MDKINVQFYISKILYRIFVDLHIFKEVITFKMSTFKITYEKSYYAKNK